MTPGQLAEKLREFFGVFPKGAGEQWIAAHLSVDVEQLRVGCLEVGAERVEIRWGHNLGAEGNARQAAGMPGYGPIWRKAGK